ncbi:MAG TPA: helix-turn-helix transcriptional regulator, partial [Blastocatellia bacterium]|nr:helix-turn-helix transcriptional regulator [Blastocatellia bacterium]
VQRVMRQKRLSIKDVQQRAGGRQKIAASYISRITSAKVTNLSVDKLLVLAQGLGVDPFELFSAASGLPQGGADEWASEAIGAGELIDAMQQAVGNPASLEVLRRWLRLGPERQAAVLDWVRFLSEEERADKQKRKRH